MGEGQDGGEEAPSVDCHNGSRTAGVSSQFKVVRQMASNSLSTADSNGCEHMATATGLAQITALAVRVTGRWQVGYAWPSPCCRATDAGHLCTYLLPH